MEPDQGQLCESLTPQAAATTRPIRPLLPGGSPPVRWSQKLPNQQLGLTHTPHAAGSSSPSTSAGTARQHRSPMTSSASSPGSTGAGDASPPSHPPPDRRGRFLTQLRCREVNLWEIHSLTDRGFYLITADYSSTMNGRRSDAFSSLNYNTGVKGGSLKGDTLYLLVLRPNADAGKTCPWLQLNQKDHDDNKKEQNTSTIRNADGRTETNRCMRAC